MPFTEFTKEDFKKDPAVWAQYCEAFENAGKGSVFFGNFNYSEREDNSERFRKPSELEKSTLSVKMCQEDIDHYGKKSKYFGRVFYPEIKNPVTGQRGKYTPQKNRAYWAGAINAGRTFVLRTSIWRYSRLSGTVIEILWLKDNGYTFSFDPNNPTMMICTPPQNKNHDAIIRSYRDACINKIAKQNFYRQRYIGLRTALIDQYNQAMDKLKENESTREKTKLSSSKDTLFKMPKVTIPEDLPPTMMKKHSPRSV